MGFAFGAVMLLIFIGECLPDLSEGDMVLDRFSHFAELLFSCGGKNTMACCWRQPDQFLAPLLSGPSLCQGYWFWCQFHFWSPAMILHHYEVCGVFPHYQAALRHQQGVLRFSSVLTLSTWRQSEVLRVRAQSYKTDAPPTEDAISKSRLSPGLLTGWLLIRGSQDPLLSFD